ncbi:hypothetical protein AAG570_003795 [Ranatra chinensis]|uniref:Uncharacterized protein n=1 Tax=Ranatra chinensis TaxID=642074 RepID=A0ABD0Y4R6_9HEMI
MVRPRSDLLSKSPDLKAPAEVKKVLKETKVTGKVPCSLSATRKTAKELPGSKPVPRHASSSPPTKPSTPETKVAINKKVFKTSSSLTKGVEKRSTKTVESERKKDLSTDKKKREKKIEGLIKNSKKDKTKDDSDKKRTKKKTENGKKKNGTKKKDKENLENTENEYELEQFGFDESGRPIKSDNFFQNLFLHSCKLSSHAVSAKRTAVVRSSSVAERARKLSEVDQNSVYKSEPSLRNFNVYLSQKRPVSESRFRSLERTSRQGSPSFSGYQMLERTDGYDRDIWEYCNQDTPAYESVRGRSSSEPPRTSPSEELYENIENMSPSVSRSPSCRRIRRAASSAKSIEGIAGIKKKVRSKSLNEADRYSQMGSASSLTDRPGYQCFIAEQVHSTRKSERFQELHKFYSSLERMAELQKATSNVDLRPRSKGEEIIDFDRWKMVRNKERAETELSRLYEQLKECQRDKDFLFKPRETVRWKGDRGLRSKEKSVEDLRQQFLKMSESDRQLKKHPTTNKDIYKPFWRGNSVADLANSLTCVTGSKRGRPVVECDRDLTKPVARISGDIGSRLWSSLSVEQVNALKSQLSEIYNTVSNLKHDRIRKMRNSLRDYEIDIAQFGSQEVLHVRRNSLVSENQLYSPTVKRSEAKRRERTKADSIGALPSYKSQLPMTEVEKKKLSMTISDEIKDRVKKRKHCSLVIPRETLGAVATIKGSKKQKSPTDSEISPRTCYSLLSDDSQEKGKDFLLVLTPKDKQHEVKKLVDDWGKNEYARVVQTTSTSSSSSASTVIHLGERESSHNKAGRSSGESPQRTLTSSQSFTNLKELFGEKHATTYATPPLKRNSPLSDSADSIYKCSSPDPMKYYRAYLSMVKAGDVRKLREKFESYDDIYNFLRSQDDGDIWRPKKRFQSDPDLTRDYLSRKGGISPVPLRTEDRYMPRINVISKTATLQRRSRTAPPKLESSRNKTGHVDRMRHFFETNEQLSLLGQMYTSTPEIPQLRDIAPYLECDWIAHRNPTRDLTPVKRTSGQRSSSVSPVRQSILKHQDMFADQEFNPEIHRPLYRYQPHSAGETATRWQQQGAHQQWTVTSRPSVTFKGALIL